MTKTMLSHQTPMSLALAIAIGGGLYYAGHATADYKNSIEAVQKDHEEFKEDCVSWRREITKLLREMSEVAKDNKRRLDLLEN